MPNNNPEDPTDILAWKSSLHLMDNKVIDQLFTISIEKGMIINKKELSMIFVKGYNCWKEYVR